MNIRVLTLLVIFVSILVFRFFLLPSIYEYFSLKERLGELEKFREEIIREINMSRDIEDEIRYMRTLMGQIDEFSVFDVPGVEEINRNEGERGNNRMCSGGICVVRESSSFRLSGNFLSLLSFLKEVMNSKHFLVIRKLEVERDEKNKAMKIILDAEYVSQKIKSETMKQAHEERENVENIEIETTEDIE